MKQVERFDHFVGLIYDTALDMSDVFDPHDANDAYEARRPEAVVQAVRAKLEAQGGSAEEADRLWQRLSPHFARSSSLRSRMRQLQVRQAIQQTELAHLPFGLVWVDAGMNVVTQNERACALLKSNTGICVKNGRLAAWVAADMERLDLALRNALCAQDRKGILLALRRRDQPVPLLASVIPVIAPPQVTAASGGSEVRFALVMLQNPGEGAIGLTHLQLVYGFTAAERKLAEALLNNETLDSYAERTAVSRSTLRSHPAHLFKKTGTCRQSELVRLLMLARPMV